MHIIIKLQIHYLLQFMNKKENYIKVILHLKDRFHLLKNNTLSQMMNKNSALRFNQKKAHFMG